MNLYFRLPIWARNILLNFFVGAIGMTFSPLLADKPASDLNSEIPQIIISGNGALIANSNPNNPEPEVAKELNVIITAYSSTVWQTDDTPFTTAAGTPVKDGIIANNLLPFGTKVRIPELYGDKVFVVEDRMSWKKNDYHFDIWFEDYWQAMEFGAKRTRIEVLEG